MGTAPEIHAADSADGAKASSLTVVDVRRDCSPNRPISGVAVGVQFEGYSCEEEVDVLCEGAVNGGPSTVRNTVCERCENYFLR